MRSDRYKEEDQKKEEKRIKMPKVKRSGKPKAERSDAAMADTGSEPKTKRGARERTPNARSNAQSRRLSA